ncbi:hypothetical protein [Cyclobacterium jeungdonense]|uniref:Uncharacterized protein n=1 Tax=Cyclobacterium jeungdonense TaxID=708087 RepID=A0ABT8CAZ3_9BACT|nr:hypothetical protein [Cyclobacterium jeungdonense]MDN3689129.1 hypothetical protein [Cyclobacterium jeungdonense]
MEENDASAPEPKPSFQELLPDSGHSGNRLQALTAVFNGLGIGLFLGLLMGLSVSPVVSGVVGTITSLLAVLIGLNEKFLDPVKSLRIGSFGLFSAVGILLGLYIRSNDPFAPSLSDKMQEYLEIGYSPEEAKLLVTDFIRADSSLAVRQANVLYSTEVSITACDFLVYADETTPPAEVFNTFETAGGLWAKLVPAFQNKLSEEQARTVLLSLRDGFCTDGQGGEQRLTIPETILKQNPEQDLEGLERHLRSLEAPWPEITNLLEEHFTPDIRTKAYAVLLQVFNDE